MAKQPFDSLYEKFARHGNTEEYFAISAFNTNAFRIGLGRPGGVPSYALTFATAEDWQHDLTMWMDAMMPFMHDSVRDMSECLEEFCIHEY